MRLAPLTFIAAIDTKGHHLSVEAAGRKLLYINKVGNGTDLAIRLVTKGRWNDQFERQDNAGYSVWSLRHGKPHTVHVDTAAKAVTACLRKGP